MAAVAVAVSAALVLSVVGVLLLRRDLGVVPDEISGALAAQLPMAVAGALLFPAQLPYVFAGVALLVAAALVVTRGHPALLLRDVAVPVRTRNGVRVPADVAPALRRQMLWWGVLAVAAVSVAAGVMIPV